MRRVLTGLDAVGVERVWIMPDRFGIGAKALDGVRLDLAAGILDMPARFDQWDTMRAARQLAELGVGAIVTLGGDGTNRMVAKAQPGVPILPISTGTNNVFPRMLEATTAGVAAGLVATGQAPGSVFATPRIDILSDEVGPDLALVDAAVYEERFVGARAVWRPELVRHVFVTRAAPGDIGLSSIGVGLLGSGLPPGCGLYLRLAADGLRVSAPIGPGLICSVGVADHRTVRPGDTIEVGIDTPSALALDGEREHLLAPGTTLELRLSTDGPRIIDTSGAITEAADAGWFRR